MLVVDGADRLGRLRGRGIVGVDDDLREEGCDRTPGELVISCSSSYELEELGEPTIEEVLAPIIARVRPM